jgi:ribosome maturation factor RimP
MKRQLKELVGRDVEIWTTDSSEEWRGKLLEVGEDTILMEYQGVKTYLVIDKISAFRISEEEQTQKK